MQAATTKEMSVLVALNPHGKMRYDLRIGHLKDQAVRFSAETESIGIEVRRERRERAQTQPASERYRTAKRFSIANQARVQSLSRVRGTSCEEGRS